MREPEKEKQEPCISCGKNGSMKKYSKHFYSILGCADSMRRNFFLPKFDLIEILFQTLLNLSCQ